LQARSIDDMMEDARKWSRAHAHSLSDSAQREFLETNPELQRALDANDHGEFMAQCKRAYDIFSKYLLQLSNGDSSSLYMPRARMSAEALGNWAAEVGRHFVDAGKLYHELMIVYAQDIIQKLEDGAVRLQKYGELDQPGPYLIINPSEAGLVYADSTTTKKGFNLTVPGKDSNLLIPGRMVQSPHDAVIRDNRVIKEGVLEPFVVPYQFVKSGLLYRIAAN
jgi:hypothetical protein